jgi:hypothetical protein
MTRHDKTKQDNTRDRTTHDKGGQVWTTGASNNMGQNSKKWNKGGKNSSLF